MMRGMRKYVPIIASAALILAGCGSSEPTAAEKRAADCEAFAAETPGVIEHSWAFEVGSDPNRSQEDFTDAVKALAREQSGAGREHPYNCDWPADRKLFEYYRQLRAE